MRPNVDIPWSIHGRIKEHAEQTDQTIEESYIETLEQGVSELPEVRDKVELPSPGFNDFGPQLVRTQGTESQHINYSITNHPFFHLSENAMEFGTRRTDMSVDEFVDRLAKLHNVGRIDRSWFTIHQLGGALVGRGPANLAKGIREAHTRFAEEEVPTYKSGHLIYIAHLAYESEYLLLRAEIPRMGREKQVLANVELKFITNGVPVTGALYQRLARAFGYNEIFNASELTLPRTGFKPTDNWTPTVTKTITTEDKNYDDPSVTGLFIENPIQGNDDLLSYLEDELSAPNHLQEASFELDGLSNYDELFCDLTRNHGLSDEHNYEVEGLSATYISPLFGRNSTWNLTVNVDWR